MRVSGSRDWVGWGRELGKCKQSLMDSADNCHTLEGLAVLLAPGAARKDNSEIRSLNSKQVNFFDKIA